ncbi:MAG: phage Gp37/Gp68 family protein [Candidatus Aegiribacteria sp.]|nr:phage Gp37/Gp68 family protein [Candidatus Aegiribacteria sp.]
MAAISHIEWTNATWNPVTGCTKISEGCENCYTAVMARRLQAMGNPKYRNGFKVTTHECALEIPLHWKKPRLVFVNSMSDLFHQEVPFEFVNKVFKIMAQTKQHAYQVLTKRPERLVEIFNKLEVTPNIWIGVTVESNRHYDRIDSIRRIRPEIRFVSFEPLLTDVNDVNLSDIDWAIVGGESGPGSRPIKNEWVTAIREKCHKRNIPFFFKQWGGVNKKAKGRVLDGRLWEEMPTVSSEFFSQNYNQL